MPFGEYDDMSDCVRKNKDKENPEAYCAEIKRKIEGRDMTDKDKGNVSASMPIIVTASENEGKSFTFAAAKVGSKSFGADGTKYIFTREALMAHAKSWEGGIITLNHAVQDDGVITAAWFDEETDLVMMTVECDNPETARRVSSGEATGVSIEASLIDVTEDNDVLAFNGTGVSVIFYPEQPACPLKDGCGILAKEQFEQKIVSASEKRLEKIHAKDYDLVRINDMGAPVKIDSVWTWDDDTDAQIEKHISNFVSYYGAGTYMLTALTDTKIGDTVSMDEPAYTVSIDINKPTGGTIVAEDKTVTEEDYNTVVAKNAELTKKLEAFETDETIKAKDAEIDSLKAKNKKLTDELDRRDSEISAKLIDEIKAWDAEFKPEEGMSLSLVQTIHASLKRAMTVTASAPTGEGEPQGEPEEDEGEGVTASEFTAPSAGRTNNGMSVGGWVTRNGVMTWEGRGN